MRWVAASGLAWHRFEDGVVLLSCATSETHLLSHAAFSVLEALMDHPASIEELASGSGPQSTLAAKDIEVVVGILHRAQLVDTAADASPSVI